MAMKASMHSGRQGSPKHNDRSFLNDPKNTKKDIKEIAPHIDIDRIKQNGIYSIGGHKDNLEHDELEAYRKLFSASLEATNSRYVKQGHAERCKTIEDVYRGRQTRPEEVILQIGDINHHVSANKLKSCYVDYINRLGKWNLEHGKPMRLLSAALHADEATPHVHVRRVWVYTDNDGNYRVGQNRALEAAGVPLPHPDKPAGRYNNRKMSFDRMARQLWIDVCRDHGIEIDDVPLHGVRHHSKQDYLASKMSDMQAELTLYQTMEKRHPDLFANMRKELKQHHRKNRFDFER